MPSGLPLPAADPATPVMRDGGWLVSAIAGLREFDGGEIFLDARTALMASSFGRNPLIAPFGLVCYVFDDFVPEPLTLYAVMAYGEVSWFGTVGTTEAKLLVVTQYRYASILGALQDHSFVIRGPGAASRRVVLEPEDC